MPLRVSFEQGPDLGGTRPAHRAGGEEVARPERGSVHGEVGQLLSGRPIHAREGWPTDHGAVQRNLEIDAIPIVVPRGEVGQGSGVTFGRPHLGRCERCRAVRPRQTLSWRMTCRGTGRAARTRTPGCPAPTSRSRGTRRRRAPRIGRSSRGLRERSAPRPQSRPPPRGRGGRTDRGRAPPAPAHSAGRSGAPPVSPTRRPSRLDRGSRSGGASSSEGADRSRA